MHFQHDSHPQRVYFGSGEAASALADAVRLLDGRRIMVIASPRAAAAAATLLEGLPVVHTHTEVAMHVPVEVAIRARQAADRCAADLLLSIGGGSATGLAKAVALTSGRPIVTVPTTYSGSEATTIWGLTDADGKTTGTDVSVLPRAVVYDTELTASLTVEAGVASGLNALAHCIDAMWAPRADPINRALAVEGIAALSTGLRELVTDPAEPSGRERTLYATYLAGVALSSAGSGLHHKICHVLGGAYRLPHAQTHAVVLPYVVALNAPAVPDLAARIGAALGSPADALAGLSTLTSAVNAPTALRDIGFHLDAVDEAVAAIMPAVPPTNPTAVTAATIRALLTAAYRGDDPAGLGTQTPRKS